MTDAVRAAVSAFNEASKLELAASALRKVCGARLQIAAFDDNTDETARLKKQESTLISEWHVHYLAKKQAAKDLCKALGLDPEAFKFAL